MCLELPYSKERRRVLRAAIFDHESFFFFWYSGGFLEELGLFGVVLRWTRLCFAEKVESSAVVRTR